MTSARDVINSIKPNITKIPRQSMTAKGSAGYDNIRDDIEKTKAVREMESIFYAIRLTAGENIAKGNIVMASRAADMTAIIAGVTDGAAGRDQAIGVARHAATTGQSILIIITGIAEVLSDGNVTRGDFINVSGTTKGTGNAAANPTVPADASHWREIGHSLESRVGAGLFKAVIHFN